MHTNGIKKKEYTNVSQQVKIYTYCDWKKTNYDTELGKLLLDIYWLIGLVVRVFANGPGDLGSIPGHVIPKTLKMVLDTSLLNTQQYTVHIKGKMEQSWERSSALPYILML